MDENVIFNNPPTSGDSSGNPPPGAQQEVPTQQPPPADVPSEDPPPIQSSRLGGGLMKKIIIGVVCFFILLFIIFLIIPKKPGSFSKSDKVAWWGLWEDDKVMQGLISDFERLHPNITIEYTKQDPDQYRQRLATRIKNGTGPDIFLYHNTWNPMFSDVLLPLPSDTIAPDTFKKDFYPVVQKDMVQNGAIYGIPLGIDSLALFVNPDIFKAAGAQVPNNWEDFVKTSKQLTVKDDTGKIKTAGAALGTFGNITHAPDIISLLFVQQGVDMKKFSAFSKNQADALNFYTAFAKGGQSVWDDALDESILAFSKGNLAMYFGYSWDIFRMQSLNKNLQFKVYPVPRLFNQNETIVSYWVNGVSVKSQNQKNALLFMQYLSQKDTAQKFYSEVAKTRAFGEPPARIDLASTLKSNALIYPFVSQLSNASSTLFSSDTHDGDGGLNFLVNSYLGTAVDSMVKDSSSAESVVDALDQGYTQALLKYGIQ